MRPLHGGAGDCREIDDQNQSGAVASMTTRSTTVWNAPPLLSAIGLARWFCGATSGAVRTTVYRRWPDRLGPGGVWLGRTVQ
jgi:hypothetical protein